MTAKHVQRGFLFSAILIAAVLLPADLHLQARDWRVAQNALSAEQRIISRQEAAAIARRSTGGKVLSVSLKNGNRPFYVVKVILDSKRVKTIRVDARSGNVR